MSCHRNLVEVIELIEISDLLGLLAYDVGEHVLLHHLLVLQILKQKLLMRGSYVVGSLHIHIDVAACSR